MGLHISRNDKNKKENEYLEELQFLFNRAVNRQLVSDVDIGSYLSGGMDSGSITALASKKIDKLRTFTCGFDLNSVSGIELNFDEEKLQKKFLICLKQNNMKWY